MPVITILPDFGGGYAWHKKEDDGTALVGTGIADKWRGFSESEFGVSAELEQEFARWHQQWETRAEREVFADTGKAPHFDWTDFNNRGMELARKLKAEVGPKARVVIEHQGKQERRREPVAGSPGRFRSWKPRWEILDGGDVHQVWVELRVPKNS